MSDLEPDTLLEMLLLQLDDSWEQGAPLPLESLIQQAPPNELAEDDVLQLIYSEIDLRSQHGERPLLSEYVRRFPKYGDRLQRLFEIHFAFENELPANLEPLPKPAEPKPARDIHFELANPPPLPPLKPPSHQQETFIRPPSPLDPPSQ